MARERKGEKRPARDDGASAGEAPRQGETQYRQLLDLCPDPVVVVEDDRHVFANQAFTEVFGYTQEDVASGLSLFELVQEKDKTAVRQRYEGRLAGKPLSRTYRLSLVAKDGSIIPCETSAARIEHRGRPVVLAILRDITERVRVEEALRLRIALEEAVGAISTEFVGLPAEEVDAAINRALKRMGELTDSDRSYVFLYADDGRTMSNTHEWCAEGIEPQLDRLQDLPLSVTPWVIERLKRGQEVHIPLMADLPPEASAEEALFEALDIQSLVVVPMSLARKPIGFLGFDAVRAERTWEKEDVHLLRTVGDIFVTALERRRAEEELRYRVDFERLISTISSDFINLSAEQVDEAIHRALQSIGEFAGVDRSYVFQFSDDLARVSCTHEWCGDGIEPAIDQLQDMPIDLFPWALERHRRGEIVHVPRVADLPPEARAWRQELEREGVRSLLCVPKIFAGKVRGFVGFDAVRAEKAWSGDEIALLRLAGEVFTNTLERQRAEEELRTSEARFRAVVTDQTEMINRYLSDTTITFINEAACRMLGTTAEELIGKPWLPFVAEEHQERVRKMIASLDAENPIATIEHQVVAANGEVRWQQWTNRAICDEQGRVVEYQAVGRDVTERKRTEEALRESEERYRAIFEQAPDSILLIDAQNRTLVAFNRRSHENLGYTREEFETLTLADFEASESPQEVAKHIEKIVKEGSDTFETKHETKSGEVRDIIVNVRAISIGGRAFLQSICHDITDRKRTEEALRESEERFRTLFESASDAIFILDMDGTFVDVNRVAHERLGYTREEMLSMHIAELNPPPFTAKVPERIELVKRQGRAVFESAHVRKDGTVMPVEVNAWIVDLAGENRMLSVTRDITERKRTEEELRRAERLESLGVLAGGIAHDFNNMLMGIMTSLSLARLNVGTSADVARMLAEGEKAVIRAKGLTQQLLTFSRGGAPVRRAASVAELLQDTAQFALAGSNVRCQFTLPDDLWAANIDATQISQVVQNLVINAMQAMPKGGVIEIAAENLTLEPDQLPPLRPGDYVKVAVKDRGVGIRPENLPRIFDPYFTTKGTGSGLGLAVCHSIVRNHDGHVRVDSRLGVGTTVEVYLPAPDRRAAPPQEAAPERPTRHGRVLLMDDEDMIRRGARLMLQEIGYQVECAADGAEAVELYQNARGAGRPFDAVVLDLTVPAGMGGEECLRRLREIDPGVRAVVSSGYSDDPIMAAYEKHGFRAVASKPYTLEELIRALDEAMEDRAKK